MMDSPALRNHPKSLYATLNGFQTLFTLREGATIAQVRQWQSLSTIRCEPQPSGVWMRYEQLPPLLP
jgi:hypothetical protein